ncbi:hypothetical protein JCM11251_006112 [Rhodosporidiobolus azoricus]
MSDAPNSPPTGSLPLRSSKASARIAEAAAKFIGQSSPSTSASLSSSPQRDDLSRLRESKRVDAMRQSTASSTSRSAASSPSTPPPRTLAPSQLHRPASHSPSTELASFLANLSITESPSLPTSFSPASRMQAVQEPASPTLRRKDMAPDVPSKVSGALGMLLNDEKMAKDPERLDGGDSVLPEAPPPVPPKKASTGSECVPFPSCSPSQGTDIASLCSELALLAILSSITELSMSIQEINSLIFEIQELRHTTSVVSDKTPRPDGNGFASQPPEGSSPVSDVDAALMRLDTRLAAVRAEFAEVEPQVKRLLGEEDSLDGELGVVRTKWAETLVDWDSAQQDADQLGEELKEDKWLVVFRTVSLQAEDMLRSMEKVLSQSEQFIHDAATNPSLKHTASPRGGIPRSPSAPISSLSASPSSSYFPDLAAAHSQLTAFHALHKSLNAKIKYYAPACDRVLKILGKGIGDRSTKNGEVLRRYSEMKARWRNLQERIQRTEAEMTATGEVLKERGGQAASPGGTERTRQSEYGNTLTPPRPDPGSPGRLSPLRRLANKMSPRNGMPSSSTPPISGSPSRPRGLPVSASSPTISTLGASTSSSRAGPTPPRPPKSVNRLASDSKVSAPTSTPPRTPQALSHRRSASALPLGLPSSASATAYGSRAARPPSSMRRAPSPTPSDGRPRWNVSTRRTSEERETLTASAMGGGRPSLAGAFPSSASRSGRNSSLGMRPPSRMSLTSSMSHSYGPGAGRRPVSPAFSDASSTVHRERPQTPGSRIPMPSPALRRSTTAFSSLDDDEPTSLMQRTMSPPSLPGPRTSALPRSSSSQRLSLARSAGPSSSTSSSSRSHLPTPGTLSPPRATSPAFSASSSVYGHYRGQTPEPNLVARAQRLSHVRPPPASSASSRPPPVPRVPSAYRASVDPQATPRASTSGTFSSSSTSKPRASYSRPPSALSTSRYGTMTPLPTSGEASAYPYSPNPLDPLDCAVSSILSSLPLMLHVCRVEPPLTRAQAAQTEVFSARYTFGLHPLEDGRRAVMCKLVDRVGPRARKGEKKVLVRTGGGWQDLESHLLGVLASTV